MLLRGANRLVRPNRRSIEKLCEEHGFVLQNVCEIEEFDLTTYHMLHQRTKARYVHVDSDDTNNVFAVVFPTPAKNSSGLPHILEHTVLCGSERFPVRDPFFNMLKRSLNTFMNALTASDHTMYPFATKNSQDFANLMDVYLDAAFFPKLSRLDFLQEGHRLERDPEDPSLVNRTGVVYNEMKGTLGNASTLFHYKLNEELFRGTVYANVSGGDPAEIGTLTHEDLVAFHKVHYHPTNALFFTYGDLPLENHMKIIDDNVLKKFDYCEDSAKVRYALQERDDTSTSSKSKQDLIRIKGPAEPFWELDQQAKYCFSRVITDDMAIDDKDIVFKKMIMGILSTLLFDGPSSPMYAALIDSQLAPDFAGGAGYDSHSLLTHFGFGVQGINGNEEKLDQIRKVICDTLVEVVHKGFDPRRVESVLHLYELSLKQVHINFGLAVMHTMGGAFTHEPSGTDENMIHRLNDSLKVNEKLSRLVQFMKESPTFWQDEIKKHFLENDETSESGYRLRDDFIHIVMEPDTDFVEKLETMEKDRLRELSKTLSAQDLAKIDAENAELEHVLSQDQDVSCLPSLSIKDIPKMPEEDVVVEARYDNNLLWVDNVKTNGIVYMRALFDIRYLPDELRPFIPLFCSFLSNIDTNTHSYQDLSIETDLISGGMGFSNSIISWHDREWSPIRPSNHKFSRNKDGSIYREGILVTTSCFARNLDKTVELLGDILTGSRFNANPHHLQSLLATKLNTVSSNVSQSALSYARTMALSSYGGECAQRETSFGLSQLELLKWSTQHLPKLAPIFQEIMHYVFRPQKMTMCVVAGGSEIDKTQTLKSVQRLGHIIGDTNCSHPLAMDYSFLEKGGSTFHEQKTSFTPNYIQLALQVHNCVVGVSTNCDFGHPDDAAMTVLGQLINSCYLHKHIRERGGAYGSGASFDLGGVFQLSSYYDPNATETLRTFSKGLEWACNGGFTDRDVDEALLSVFSSIDSPQEPKTYGSGPFLYGISRDSRQEFRERFFELNKARLVETANRHFASKIAADHNGFVNVPLMNGCVAAVAGNADTNIPSWNKRNFTNNN